MQSILQAVRMLDLFAVPVSLTYKGQKAFNTILGGFCSLLLIIGFGTFITLDLHKVLTNPDFSETSTSLYASYQNSEPYELNTLNQTVALSIYRSDMTNEETNSYFRVYFLTEVQTLNADNTTTKVETPVAAVLCRDFYSAEIRKEASEGQVGFFTQEYVNTVYDWVCPDLSQISLLNVLSTDIEHNA